MAPTFSLEVLGRILVVAGLGFLAIWTLWSFLPALGWAAVLALATWPIRQWLVRRGLSPTGAAILLTGLLGLVIIAPLLILVFEGARESRLIVQWITQVRATGIGTPEWLGPLPIIGSYLASWWQEHLADPEAAKELLGRAEALSLMQWSRQVGHQLISRVIILGFTLLTLLFLYRDGPQIMQQTENVANRLSGARSRPLGREAIATVRATVNGLVLVGLAEGALLGIGYVIVGLPHPLLLGLATGIFAAVPFGAPVVYVIACIFLIVSSHITAAILLFVFASVIVFIADHFVRPALIGLSTRLPFLWILLGIFGGLETFGFLGIFLGPAILAAVLALWREAATPAAESPAAET
jgi:predicted PurR-regulated permease PerM